jgi:hypothetical protein
MMVAEQVRPTIRRTNHALAGATGAEFSLAVAAFGFQCAGKSWLPIVLVFVFVKLELVYAALHAAETYAFLMTR